MSNSIPKLRKQVKNIFADNKVIVCPAFPNEVITFNAKGINHLFYKGSRSRRNLKELKVRINLLPLGIKLLQLMPIFQEYQILTLDIEIKEAKQVHHYWAFEGVIENRKLKVIIRQINNGQKHFYSVIPSWRKDKLGNRLNFKKNLKEEN